MPSATIEISPPPTSVNRTRGEHWNRTRRRKTELERDIGLLLLAAGVPRPIPGDRVHATAVLRFPTERRRDEGNFRAPLEKALGDQLQAGGWLTDDTPEHFTFGALTFERSPLDLATLAAPSGRRGTALRRRPAHALVTITWGED